MSKKWYLIGGVLLILASTTLVYMLLTDSADKTEAEKSASIGEEVDKSEEEETTEEKMDEVDNEETIALFKNVKGDVHILRGNEVIPINADELMSINLQDRLKTGENSSVSMYFHEETSIHLGENSEIVINKWNDEKDNVAIEVEHVIGQLWHDVKTGDQYEVTQDQNIVKVKGTLFLTHIDPNTGQSVLTVLEGIVGVDRANSRRDSNSDTYPDVFSFIQYIWDQDDDIPIASIVDIEELVRTLSRDVQNQIIDSLLNHRNENDQFDDDEQYRDYMDTKIAFIANMLNEMRNQNQIEEQDLRDLLDEISVQHSFDLDNLPSFTVDRGDLDRIEQELEERRQAHRQREEERARARERMNENIEQRRQELLLQAQQRVEESEQKQQERERPKEQMEREQESERMKQERNRQREERERERERPKPPSPPSPPIIESKITFKVTDGAIPIGQAQITIGDLQGKTDADGKITFTLKEGTYEYVVIADDYEIEKGSLKAQNEIEHHVNLKLIPGTVVGQVIEICPYGDCHPSQSNDVSGANVYVFADEKMVAEVKTDEAGYFELNNLPVNKDLYILTRFISDYPPNDSFVELRSESFQLAPGEKATIDLVHKAGYKVHFTVTDGYDGIENATVELRSNSVDGAIEKNTNKDGEVIFYLSEGDYNFIIHADGYLSQESYFTVGQEDIEIEPYLEPMPGTITGQVVATCIGCLDGEDETMPLSDVYISIFDDQEEISGRGTNEQGYFEIDNLPPYTDLVVMAQYHGEWFSFELTSDVVQFKPGETIEVNFEYEWEPIIPELPVFVGDAGINAMGLYWDLYGEGYEYHIYLRELRTENDFELVEKTDALDYTLMDLKPGTEYLIRVEAWWPGADSYDAVGEVSASTMEDMYLWRTKLY